MDIIRTDSLTKQYKDIVAVNNISLHVKQGEIYGFLGLNGAGKTTTIRLLLDMIKPSAGYFKLFNRSIKSTTIWNEVGYLVEAPYAYPNLSVIDNLKIFSSLRNLEDQAIYEVIERLQLKLYIDRKYKDLSQGNKQRLGLAKALIHKPKLLILDEPINGLDPEGIVEIRKLLLELANQGTTIFLSSHILSEISKIATRIGIIHYGHLVKELYIDELEMQLNKFLIIETRNNLAAVKLLNKAGFNNSAVTEKQHIEMADPFALDNPDKIAEFLVTNEYPPMQMYKYTEDLEHFFLRIIGKEGK